MIRKKEILLFVLVMLSISIVLSEEIDFIYPESVVVGEEFDVSLKLLNFSLDIYDIKIDIKNGSKYIAKIFWDNEWRANRWNEYVINLSEKDSATFRLNITENYQGISNITVKIRDSVGSSNDFEYSY